jgi:hypothetical protein
MDYIKNQTHIFKKNHRVDHYVAFKCLHKGLQPFTNIGMHKKGVWLPGDVQCGACLP